MDAILKKIKLAETDAKKKVEQARKKAELRLREISDKIQGQKQMEEERLDKEHAQTLEQYDKEMEKIKEKSLAKGKSEAQALERDTRKNMQKAVSLVVQKFEEEIK
ncbi:hypothetical protein GOV09_03775 [Candidatus Woesearchaeota archaeon]|nr:hypothetical protein [Candidatus Woesearchaeota archaeon]